MKETYRGRALTVLQPSAQAIVVKIKPWENRPDPAPKTIAVGEWIALHAGVSPWPLAHAIRQLWPECPPDNEIPWGAVIGLWRYDGSWQKQRPIAPETVRRVAHVDGRHYANAPTIPADWPIDSSWAFGPWCYRVGDVIKLPEPIPVRGFQGWWSTPAEVTEQLFHVLQDNRPGVDWGNP